MHTEKVLTALSHNIMIPKNTFPVNVESKESLFRELGKNDGAIMNKTVGNV